MIPIDLCIDLIGAGTGDILATAVAADRAGFASVAFADELC